MSSTSSLRVELEQAKRFVNWLTGQSCELIAEPDSPGRPSRHGGHPEAVFRDRASEEYVVEVKRLLTPTVRSVEDFAKRHIAEPVKGLLSGTFTLVIDINQLVKGKLDQQTANILLSEIEALGRCGTLRDQQDVEGFPVTRVLQEGSALHPLITGPGLPYDVADRDPEAGELKQLFEEQVLEADAKFEGYKGHRIFLMDIGQSGLDLEFHAQRFKGGQGILLTWAQGVCPQTRNLDFLFLEPGVRVWLAGGKGDMPQIYAGTKWVDKSRGFYQPIWRRSGRSPLGRFRF